MELHTAERLEGIGEYYFSQKLGEIERLNQAGRPVINLGIGSPDLAPHRDVISVLREESAKNNVHAYQSYRGSPILRKAISEWYQRWYSVSLDPATEVLPLIGSKEGILHICMTYLNKGDQALVPNPGYPAYQAAVRLAGADSVEYELRQEHSYYPDFHKLEQLNLQKVKLMFVNYPQMPTGQSADLDCFEKLVQFALKNNILLVHDNPYSFILNDNPRSILSIKGAKQCVVELNSLSKSHNMAGWRVGMLCGDKKRIDQVLSFKSNMDSGMFLPIQLAAAKALALGKNWFDDLNAIYRQRREHAWRILTSLGAVFTTNQNGLFTWAAIPPGYNDAFEFSDVLLHQAGVFITPGGVFGTAGNQFIRISLCSPVEKFIEATSRIDQFTQESITKKR